MACDVACDGGAGAGPGRAATTVRQAARTPGVTFYLEGDTYDLGRDVSDWLLLQPTSSDKPLSQMAVQIITSLFDGNLLEK